MLVVWEPAKIDEMLLCMIVSDLIIQLPLLTQELQSAEVTEYAK